MPKDDSPRRDAVRPVPVWRRIADLVRADIVAGRHAPGAQLPPERQLAATHGASRVTARRALIALEQEGLLRIDHGNGTFVTHDVRVRYALGGDRVRFTQNFTADTDGAVLMRRLLSSRIVAGDATLAAALGLAAGVAVLELQILSLAGERPLAVATYAYDAVRFAGLDRAFAGAGSLTAALARFGVADYRRQSTEVTARLPTAAEARVLAQSKVQPVLAYDALDCEVPTGRPLAVITGCFAADRVSVVIATGAAGG